MSRPTSLLAALMMLNGSMAWAAEGDPVGPEFQVSTTSTVNNPDVAMDGNGNFVSVWQGGGGNLLMQRYDNAGARRGSEAGVNAGTTNAFTPRIGVDNTGNYAIVWNGSTAADSDGVYLRRFDANGAAQGTAPALVNTTVAGSQNNPDIAMNASGAFVVAWVDVDGASQTSIKAQRFNAAGTPQGAELAVSTSTAGARARPAVGIDDSGNFVVVWEADGDGDQSGVIGRRYDSNGAPLSGEVVMNPGITGAQTYPAISMAGNGSFVVAWFSWNGNNAVAQRYAVDGTRVGAELTVAPAHVGFSGPDVAMDDAGKFLVVWERSGAESGGSAFSFGVFGRRYAADGTAAAAFQINTSTTNNQDFCAVAMDTDGDTVVVWQSAHLRSNLDIFAQRYAGSGTPPPTDTTPDAFAFVDQSAVVTNATITSNSISVSGINAPAPISITGGSYSIGCGASFTNIAGTVNQGDAVCVRHTSASANSTATNTTLTIGGVSDTFTSTTQAPPPDTTPDAFTFTSVADVQAGSAVTSNTVTIGGINAPAAITVTGGEYSLGCGGTFTSAAGQISNAQTVCVRHTASASASTTVSTTLTIGGVSSTFSSTTAARRSGGGGVLDLWQFGVLLALLLAQVAWRTAPRLPVVHRRSGGVPGQVTMVCGALLALVSTPAPAGGAFETALGSDMARIAAKAKISMMNGDNEGRENGNGLTPYLKKLGKPPARVALVSFYVWDVGNSKSKTYNFMSSNYTYRINTYRAFNVGTGELSVMANELHDAAIGPLKQSFATQGMQLLTAPEYTDTPARKQAYDAYKWEAGGFTSLMKSLQGKGGLEWSRGMPDGYKLIEMFTRGNKDMHDFEFALNGIGVGKFGVSVGHDLAKALDVEAVVIMYSVVQAEKTSINMLGTGLYMFGPNPVAENGQSMYYSGHQYSGLYLKLKDIPIVTVDKKGGLLEADYQGFGAVAGALGARMAEHIKKKTG